MSTVDQKIHGWEWVSRKLAMLLAQVHAETDRLLGPDRGE